MVQHTAHLTDINCLKLKELDTESYFWEDTNVSDRRIYMYYLYMYIVSVKKFYVLFIVYLLL